MEIFRLCLCKCVLIATYNSLDIGLSSNIRDIFFSLNILWASASDIKKYHENYCKPILFFDTVFVLYQIFNALHFTSIYKFHHIFAPKNKILWCYDEKMGTLLPSERWKSSNPSTRKVVFLTYKFSSSSSFSINNPALVMLVFLHCLVRDSQHRAQETFLCLLPKPQQQMFSVCFSQQTILLYFVGIFLV